MRIVIGPFGGEAPKVSPELLPPHRAQTAENCKLYSGELRPFGGLRRVYEKPASQSTLETIYRFEAAQNADKKGVITAINAVNPVEITSTAHGLTTADQVFIAGLNAGSHTLNDTLYTVTVINANTFSLDGVNGTGMAAITSPGYWSLLNGYWFTADEVVNYVRGAISGDTTERTFYTLESDQPRYTDNTLAYPLSAQDWYPDDYVDLGIPAPATALVATATGQSGSNFEILEGTYGIYDVVVPLFLDTVPLPRNGVIIQFESVGGATELNGNRYELTWDSSLALDKRYLIDPETGVYIDPAGITAWTSGGTWERVSNATPDSPVLESEKVDFSYVYTYVNSTTGNEGPPSDPDEVEWDPSKYIALSSIDTPPTGLGIDKVRIYRTNGGDEYYFLQEINSGVATATDYTFPDRTDELLPSLLWDPPPTDMTSLINLPNGVMAGVSQNRLCFSVPGLPHAWPPTYQKTTNDDFVGCGSYDTTVVALTSEDAYLANGADPENVTLEKLNIRQGCVSSRSIVSVSLFGVIYASPDGLISIGRNGINNITEGYFERNEWQALHPETMHAVYHEGRYVCFYDDGVTPAGFIFDPSAPEYGLVFIDVYATAAYHDPFDDTLYLVVDDYIQAWDNIALSSIDPITYTWKSKKFASAIKVSYTCAKVRARSYDDLTLKLYADGVLVHTQTVTSEEPFRLTSYSQAEVHEIELIGTDYVIPPVVVGESFDELEVR